MLDDDDVETRMPSFFLFPRVFLARGVFALANRRRRRLRAGAIDRM